MEKMAWFSLNSIFFIHWSKSILIYQWLEPMHVTERGSFWGWAQPMKDDVTISQWTPLWKPNLMYRLDRKRRKLWEICLRPPPLTFTKPQNWPVSLSQIAPKLEISRNCGHKLINSDGDQDISACKISGQFLNGFPRKCPKPPNFTCFTKSK